MQNVKTLHVGTGFGLSYLSTFPIIADAEPVELYIMAIRLQTGSQIDLMRISKCFSGKLLSMSGTIGLVG